MTVVLPPALALRVRMPSAWWTDLVATACLLLLMAFEYSWGPGADDGYRSGSAGISVVFSVLTIVPVAFRRIAPVSALVTSIAAIVVPHVFHLFWVMFWTGFMVVVFLLYTVARHRPWRVALVASLLPPLASIAQHAAPGADPGGENPLVADLLLLVTFELFVVAFGIALRRAAVQERRLGEALAELETEQADRERAAVLEVRRGLARDLHDVVAHAVSLMLVQAGAARLAVDDDPAAARRSLEAVRRAGRDAVSDLAALVAVLESTGAEAAPGGGLAGLDALLDRVRRAGLDLDVRRAGAVPLLPPGLDGAAFRIVQEALTNVLRHAGPTTAVLELRFGDPIRIAVVDDGPRGRIARPASSGLGLAGMRERAALFGGSVVAGPRAGRGWATEIELPLPEPA